MADLSDCVIDWLIDGFHYCYNIIIFSFIFGLLGATYALSTALFLFIVANLVRVDLV